MRTLSQNESAVINLAAVTYQRMVPEYPGIQTEGRTRRYFSNNESQMMLDEKRLKMIKYPLSKSVGFSEITDAQQKNREKAAMSDIKRIYQYLERAHWRCDFCDSENDPAADRCAVCGREKSTNSFVKSEQPLSAKPTGAAVNHYGYSAPKTDPVRAGTDKFGEPLPEPDKRTTNAIWIALICVLALFLLGLIVALSNGG